jgi:type II secretion system protein H
MKNRASGYTLVELLSVLAILGLIAMMAWPQYQAAADELALRQDAAVLARELRLARQNAITMGKECDLIFKASTSDIRSISYQVKQGQTSRTVSLRRNVEMVGTSFPRDPIAPSDARRSACRFLPLGTPTQGGTVHLRNNRNQSLYVAVTPVTTRVRVTETDPRI